MPTLLLQQNGIRCGGKLNGALHIGRRPANSLVILDPAVSRLHAWINLKDSHYIIADAASRTGTFVNHQLITAPRPLQDGDTIRIGAAQMIFHTADTLPANVLPIQFHASDNVDPGIFFQCQCGQLLWAQSKLAGRSALCNSCGEKMRIPSQPVGRWSPPPHPAAPLPNTMARRGREGLIRSQPPTADDQQPTAAGKLLPTCSVCHSPIAPGEPSTLCPECGLPYHQQCWSENHGCSAYGCAGAGLAAPQTNQADSSHAAVEPPATAFPWEYLLLAGSAAAIPVGALIFGIPGLILAVFAALRLKTASRKGVVALSLAISIIALVLGILVSFYWWYGTIS